MSHTSKPAARYRNLAKRYLHLARICSSTRSRNHYLRIAVQYGTLAEDEETGHTAISPPPRIPCTCGPSITRRK
jgi:hypothetical protein